MEPIYSNYVELTNHKKFSKINGDALYDQFKQTTKYTKSHRATQNTVIQYAITTAKNPKSSGTDFYLCWWDPLKSSPMRKEPMFVTHEGFKLWNEIQPSVDKMLSWWKRKGHKMRQDYRERLIKFRKQRRIEIAKNRQLRKDGKVISEQAEQEMRQREDQWDADEQEYDLNQPDAGFIPDDDEDVQMHDYGMDYAGGKTPIWGTQASTEQLSTGKTPILGGTGSDASGLSPSTHLSPTTSRHTGRTPQSVSTRR